MWRTIFVLLLGLSSQTVAGDFNITGWGPYKFGMIRIAVQAAADWHECKEVRCPWGPAYRITRPADGVKYAVVIFSPKNRCCEIAVVLETADAEAVKARLVKSYGKPESKPPLHEGDATWMCERYSIMLTRGGLSDVIDTFVGVDTREDGIVVIYTSRTIMRADVGQLNRENDVREKRRVDPNTPPL